MAKCTDCLCYDACKTIFELAFKQTLPEHPFDKAENCKNFKDKSKFVEVVRCKDCKHYCIAPYDNVPYCSHESGYCGEHMCRLFYCANGERKDNGN